MPIAHCLPVVILLASLLTGCNAQPVQDTPADQTPTDQPTEGGCTFEQVTYPEGFTFGVDGGAARCNSKINGACATGPFTGKSCITNEDCYATCTNGEWR